VAGPNGIKQDFLWKNLPDYFMKKLLNSQWLVVLFRLILGVVFIYASLDKIAHPGEFARIVYNYKILPGYLVNVFAITMPWVELLCGLFLISGLLIEASSLILTLLIIAFIIALSVNFLRGINIACGCFTTDPNAQKTGIVHLVEDILLLMMSIQVLFYNRNFLSLQKIFQKR